MPPDIDARQFEKRLRELATALGSSHENEGSVECVGCKACNGSTFCRDSERLVRCHYCVRCAQCTDSSHCRGSRGLIGCNHCVDCEGCSGGSYLVRCVAVTNASYCFGCVGLGGKDFHVLNEPYDRSSYFALTKKLAKELGLDRPRAP